MKFCPSWLIFRSLSSAQGCSSWLVVYLTKSSSVTNGNPSVRMRCVTRPRHHRSTANVYDFASLVSALPYVCKSMISGAKYPRVPMTVRRAVMAWSARLLIPKSPILTCHGVFDTTKMFCGTDCQGIVHYRQYAHDRSHKSGQASEQQACSYRGFQISMSKFIIVHVL